jgi:hypothetical protein
MTLITANEAWITGTILGLFHHRRHVPGTDLTVHPQIDGMGNWNNRLEVRNPDGRVVAYITVTDTGED